MESGILCSSKVLDLRFLPLAFSPSLTVASRLLHPYSIDDKTSRLMVKQFSTARNIQRDSPSYKEKRRGRREIEEHKTLEEKGRVKARAKNRMLKKQDGRTPLLPPKNLLFNNNHKKDDFWSSTFQISTFFREVMRCQDKHVAEEGCSRDGRMLKGERWDGRKHRQSRAGVSPAALIRLAGKHLNL